MLFDHTRCCLIIQDAVWSYKVLFDHTRCLLFDHTRHGLIIQDAVRSYKMLAVRSYKMLAVRSYKMLFDHTRHCLIIQDAAWSYKMLFDHTRQYTFMILNNNKPKIEKQIVLLTPVSPNNSGSFSCQTILPLLLGRPTSAVRIANWTSKVKHK